MIDYDWRRLQGLGFDVDFLEAMQQKVSKNPTDKMVMAPSLDEEPGRSSDTFFLSEEKLPESYRKGLTEEEQDIAKREAKDTMRKAERGEASAKDLYKDWESDKRFRKRQDNIPVSPATKAFHKNFAEKKSGVGKSLQEKSKKSGIPVGILRQVFQRGMAAWRSGHRPGVAPQQWAHGRVNSFITGVGKAREADADLWKKFKGKSK